jgi:rhodanese-related sulfurtransferase
VYERKNFIVSSHKTKGRRETALCLGKTKEIRDYKGYMGNYAGDIDITQAWEVLSTQDNAILVDVRTAAEWQFSGVPTLRLLGKEVFFIPWLSYPTFEFNNNFFPTFESMNVPHDADVLLLCKVGGRSRDAAQALAQRGYEKARSIEWGFEGVHNDNNQRGQINGWKAAGLPWEQA